MKTVQIDCILEFNFEGDLTREELIEAAYETLSRISHKEIGEMLQIEEDSNEWHCFDNGEEMATEE